MSDKNMIKRGTVQVLQARSPALNGDEVARSVFLQQRLTNEALEHRRSVLQVLFPSELTKEVRAAEHDIVLEQLQTTQEVLRYLDDAGKTMLRAALDQVVTNGVADARADTSSRLLARREELEMSLSAAWRRFCEAAVEEQRWASVMPPAVQKLALQKIDASLNGFYSMMIAMLREFEDLVHQKVGR
jgi:hypothetical protein